MYKDWLGAAYLAEEATETAHRGYVNLTRIQMSAQAPEHLTQHPDYPDTPHHKLPEEVPKCTRCTFI